MEGFTRANLFELFGDSIQVSYASTTIVGGPILSYRDAQRSLSFRGAEIRAQETELGELITVTLEAIPDLRTMTFTLILPIVTVLSNLVHFLLGLPILIAFLIYFDAPIELSELPWFPIAVFVQFLLTLGFALILSALTVHFRDLKDILGNVMQLWFFATPIIYAWFSAPERIRPYLNLNPFTHLAITYQQILIFPDTAAAGGAPGHWKWLLALGVASTGLFLFGYFLFDRLRDSFAEEV